MIRYGLATALLGSACGRLGFDSTAPAALAITTTATRACSACATLASTVEISPPRGSAILVVSIAIGLGSTGTSPASSIVNFGGSDLTLLTRMVLLQGSYHPVAEQWLLIDPPNGSGDLEVTLAGQADSLLVATAAFDGVNADSPIRTSVGMASNNSELAVNTVASAAGDLVVDSVCAGFSVDSAAVGQTPIFTDYLGDVSSCGNLAAAITPGAPSVTLQWAVNAGSFDNWIDIASSIEPASD